MADARALLRAKRQEARVNHIYASYSSSGQLRCTVCEIAIKQASMWDGHIGSKAHRVNVMNMREQAQRDEATRREEEDRERQREEETLVQGKRKGDEDTSLATKKRRVGEDESETTSSHFPAGFFSDPSRAPPAADDDDMEDSEATLAPSGKTQLDLEWEAFQATVINAPEVEMEDDRQEAYARATIFAEPEMAPDVPQGFPSRLEGTGDADAEAHVKEETEDDRRKRKEQEERELIMDRLVEEERAQEEADSRVGLLKAKLEALKKSRTEKRLKTQPK
ncbi:hypothetical protein BD410DRAFT_593106 [Rickenella mellea]|uniref:Uncharacterized protein n=1 Tax=Rickenella mellea TaxID=50990 RepID=A0A4Y7QDJ3_9AGAM|nr:hypothetical protein BD410DRAFT_593106 [Rickenella mellea]